MRASGVVVIVWLEKQPPIGEFGHLWRVIDGALTGRCAHDTNEDA